MSDYAVTICSRDKKGGRLAVVLGILIYPFHRHGGEINLSVRASGGCKVLSEKLSVNNLTSYEQGKHIKVCDFFLSSSIVY